MEAADAREVEQALAFGTAPGDAVTFDEPDSQAENLAEDGASASEGEREAMQAAAAVVVEEAPQEEPLPTVSQLVAASSVSELGYITCSLPPMAEFAGSIGRITTWPSTRPVESRSVSAKCYMHSSCGSPAKGRRVISDNQLLCLLYSGRYEPGANGARRRELAAEHKKMWSAVLSTPAEELGQRPFDAVGAASSSAAS